MDLKTRLEEARSDVAELERLYRQALGAGDESTFKQAIAQCVEEYPEDLLFSACAYRQYYGRAYLPSFTAIPCVVATKAVSIYMSVYLVIGIG